MSIHRNEFANPTGGWHIQPTFQVSQHEDHVDALHDLVSFFGCGKVRRKSAGNPVMVYTVHSTKRLLERVLPVFDEHPLRVKRHDCEKFVHITRTIRAGDHHRPEVFREIVKLAYSMNSNGRQRKRPIGQILSGSSETARQAPSDRR